MEYTMGADTLNDYLSDKRTIRATVKHVVYIKVYMMKTFLPRTKLGWTIFHVKFWIFRLSIRLQEAFYELATN